MASTIDWKQLAQQLGTLGPNSETGGTDVAQQAIAILLGEDELRATVDYYVCGGPGSELARSVLWLLRPWSAMRRCYEIYKSAATVEKRIAAVELLRVVADSRAIPWISEFLADSEPSIQNCGVGVLDQLLWGGGGDEEECAALLEIARNHSSPYVREQAAWIGDFLKQRKV
jgi:hypothetical protein